MPLGCRLLFCRHSGRLSNSFPCDTILQPKFHIIPVTSERLQQAKSMSDPRIGTRDRAMTIGTAIVVATVLVLARYLPDFRQGLFITFFALAVATLGTGNREMTIGVAIVLATVLVLATYHPGFRRGLLVILFALAIAGASVAFIAMLEQDHRRNEEDAARDQL